MRKKLQELSCKIMKKYKKITRMKSLNYEKIKKYTNKVVKL